MELLANAVAAKLAHHAKAGFFHAVLHGAGNLVEGNPGLYGSKTCLHAFARNVYQALALGRNLANAKHAA